MSVVAAWISVALSSSAAGQEGLPKIDALSPLRVFAHHGRTPEAVVQHTTGSRGDVVRTVAIFRDRDGGRLTPLVWIIRDSTTNGEGRTARSDNCSAVYDAVVRMDRFPAPQIQVRPSVDAAPIEYQGPPPNIGPTHSSYVLVTSGVTTNNEPVSYMISHLGSGPIEDWLTEADRSLTSCWRTGD